MAWVSRFGKLTYLLSTHTYCLNREEVSLNSIVLMKTYCTCEYSTLAFLIVSRHNMFFGSIGSNTQGVYKTPFVKQPKRVILLVNGIQRIVECGAQ